MLPLHISLHTWCTDGAEQDGVVLLELVKPAVGDVLAGLFVRLGAPVEVGEAQVEGAQGVGERLEHGDGRVDHLRADPVGGDASDAVALVGSWGGSCRRHSDDDDDGDDCTKALLALVNIYEKK